MRSFCLLLTLTAFLSMSCATAPVEQVVDDAAQKEADINAIKEISVKWLAAGKAGNADAFTTMITDDFIRMGANSPSIVGKEAFRNSQQAFFEKNTIVESTEEIVAIRFAGDWAFVRGTGSSTVVPRDGGDPIHDRGKWVGICERQSDGSWKYSLDIYNSDLPLPE